jgi:DNA-binding transcriptional LysR family regulator
MAIDFDLHRLRLLRELKHRGTISAVAVAMSYSHSAVSQQLKILEGEVLAPLMQRDGRRVRLTPQAETLVRHIEAVLQRLDEAEADLARGIDEISGTFRIAAFQTVMFALIPSVLEALRDTHPKLFLEVAHADPEEALSRLQVRDFDLIVSEVFAGQPLTSSSVVKQTVLHRDVMRLAIPSTGLPYAGARNVSELVNADWAMEPHGSPAREWADRMCAAAGFVPRARYESPDMLVHEALVRKGHAVAFLPDLLWTEVTPSVALYQLQESGYRDLVCSVRAGASNQPAVRQITSAFQDACRTADDAITVQLATH